MADKQSEERTLPASKKKIADARRKGQVARSQDLVTGVALVGSIGFLIVAAGSISDAAAAMFERAGDVAAMDFTTALGTIGDAMRSTMLRAVAPLLLLVPSLVVVASVVMLQGIPFVVDPISPNLGKLSPTEGLKKLVGLKSLIELAKALVKAFIVLAGFVAVGIGGLDALTRLPACGFACIPGTLRGLAVPLLEVAAGAFLIAGVVDVALQRWLFLRDQKMSLTEARRERKDLEGARTSSGSAGA
jgi:type III secretion protein U